MNNNSTKEKILRICKKALKVIAIVILIIILPDLLFQIRLLIKKVPFISKILYKDLSDIEYIQMMIGTLINCVAMLISCFAYYVAEIAGKSQVQQHNQEILISAINMSKNINRNSHEIFDIKKGTGDITNLYWDPELEKNSICLIAAKKLSFEQRKIWQAYQDKIIRILKYHELADDKHKEEKINEYCNKFFKEDTEILEYNSQMNELLITLYKIEEGE